MSHINGIGASQQLSNVADAVAASSVGKATKTDSESSFAGSSTGVDGRLDGASLSSAASVVAQALSGSDVRSDKVASLQQAIATGNYSVPSSAVAGHVLNALLN